MAGPIIRPLHVGTVTRPMKVYGYGFDSGTLIDGALIAWYIEGSDKRILVDTGGVDPANAPLQLKPYKKEEDQKIENALKRIGVKCDDIDVVVITHMHWDHCAGTKLFPKAKIIVQKEELESARSPFPIYAHVYLKDVIEGINYTVISGDKKIARGVTAILIPGHTYGLQGVLVEGLSKKYFIASDTFGLFKNLDFTPPMISGIYVDLRKYYESLKKIDGLGAHILPGHDPEIFVREVYS